MFIALAGILAGFLLELPVIQAMQCSKSLQQLDVNRHNPSFVAQNRAENIRKQIGDGQRRHPYPLVLHAGTAFFLGILRQQPHAPVNNINTRSVIIDGRRQGPGSNLGKHAQSKPGVLFKIALMPDDKRSKQITPGFI